MTTTADKIKFALDRLRAKSKNDTEYADSILDFFGLGQEHRFSVFAFVFKNMDLPGYIEEHLEANPEILKLTDAQKAWIDTIPKPPDPKPLDGWVNSYETANLYAKLYRSYEIADGACSGKGEPIHMREITPQDEQDRLDAKRYRRYKELAKSQAQNWYLRPDKWDEEIDKTME